MVSKLNEYRKHGLDDEYGYPDTDFLDIDFDTFENILNKYNVYVVNVTDNKEYNCKEYTVDIPPKSYNGLANELDNYSNVTDSSSWYADTYRNDYYSNGSYRDTYLTKIYVGYPDSRFFRESMYLDEGIMDGLFTPPDLKAVLKSLKKLNQCVDELSDFDNNNWLNRDKVLPLLSDSRSLLANIFKHYELLIQEW